MTIKYHVRLSAEERVMLEALVKQEKPKVAQHKKSKTAMDWQFTTEDVRIKLKRLYPKTPELIHAQWI